MPDSEESPLRRNMRKSLRDIALSIKALGVDEFDLQQLKSFNITVETMSLDLTSSHDKPCYFAPYPDHLLPDPDEDALGGTYKGLDGETGDTFTRPVDRAYVMNIYLTNYISHCDMYAKGERAPWTSKW